MLKENTINQITRLNILIAEDNQFTSAQYDRILRKYGHNITLTKDGSECLQKYQEAMNQKEFDSLDKNPFDVVIVDQSMPKMSGTEVATQILAQKPNQKIIFASAYALSGNSDTKNLESRVEFLQKPFSLSLFVDRVQST